MTKIIFLFTSLLTGSVWASDTGIHLVMNFNYDQGETAAVGTGDYYFQGSDLLANVDMTLGAFQHLTLLQKGETLYNLDPKEKTYTEIPQAVRDAAKKMGKKENKGSFTSTGKKKKVAGYECEIYTRKTIDSMDTVCLNEQLYQQYRDLFSKIQELTIQDDLIASSKGFPLEIDSVGTGTKKKIKVLVTKIETGNYLTKFSIPQDYKEKNAVTSGLEMLKKMTENP